MPPRLIVPQHYHIQARPAAPAAPATALRSPLAFRSPPARRGDHGDGDDDDAAAADRARELARVEEQLRDLLVAVDDWLYYLQVRFGVGL